MEKFVNTASENGIRLRSVRRYGRYLLTAKSSLPGYLRLRRLFSSSAYKIEVLGRQGFPFALQRLGKRPMLVIGTVFFVCALYVLSSFVWFVRVSGTKSLSADAVREFIIDSGVHVGMRKSELDIRGLEVDLGLQFPQISWVGVRLRGTLLDVEIAEKVMLEDRSGYVTNLVAAKPGLIVKLIPISGEAIVKEGDSVLAGEMLVRASYEPAASGDSSGAAGGGQTTSSGDPRYVDAKAIVEARVWYQGRAETKLVDTMRVRTGRSKSAWYLVVSGRRIPLWPGRHGFDEYDVEIEERLIEFGPDRRFKISKLKETYYEVVSHPLTRTIEEAREDAIRRAEAAGESQVPPGVEVVDRFVELSQVGEGESARIQACFTIETLEDIGEAVHVPRSDVAPGSKS